MSTRRLGIGYLPFYVDYYEGICPGLGAEKSAMASRCRDMLTVYGDVVWVGGLVSDVESARRAGVLLAESGVDCVVVVTTIAVFGALPWAALEHLKLPLLLWNPQQIQTVSQGYSMVEIVRNTSQIGIQALANTLSREGRPFCVVSGYEKSLRTAQQLERYFRVSRAAKTVREARLLLVGEPFPLMTDIAVDDTTLRRHLGVEVHRVGTNDLTSRCQSMAKERVDTHLDRLRLSCAVADISEDELRRSICLSEVVSDLAEESQTDAGSVNCHKEVCLQNPAIGITACYALGVQNGQDRPFTCTGDLPTAVALLLVKALTGKSMYTEVQVMDEIREAIVIANSGEGEDRIRREGCPSVVRGNTNFAGLHGRGASFAYPLQPGPATLVSLTPMKRGVKAFRLVVAEGTILDDSLPDSGALAGFFRFQNADAWSAYERWLEAGPVHHAATTTGHWSAELEMVARILDLEFVSI